METRTKVCAALSFGIFFALLCQLAVATQAQVRPSPARRQFLPGHVPAAVKSLQPVDRVPAANHLDLAISLPLRNMEQLAKRLQQVYNPASPDFHHYLTSEQFTEMFGPSEQDYQAVIEFAKRSGFEVTGTHPNRTLLDVRASVADIEKTLHVGMNRYQHPTENRTFFASDVEPSLDLAVPVLWIAGLNDFFKPRALSHRIRSRNPSMNGTPQGTGSAPGGGFLGNDFRAAYVPGVSLSGAGQTVGLLEFDSGFYQSDITAYESLAHLPNVPVMPVLIDGYNGLPTNANDEVSLDIEVALAMAPGLDQILVYEGSITDDILNRMATDNVAKQIGASWVYGIDAGTIQIFQQFAAQGQSYFNASGDGGAWIGGIATPADNPYITIVGGTTLTTSGAGGAWASEAVWNTGNEGGSGGGISATYPIPSWQANIDMSANHGSTTMRNTPDVALTAENVYIILENGNAGLISGTSCATPLWAAFTALVNEQALAGGRSTVGFINPALYGIGQGLSYGSCFHDIVTGNNTNSLSPNLYYAVPGYDLCTGWGTPAGISLINGMATPDFLQILPTAGFSASGGVGGPFTVDAQTLTLTNAGTNALAWTVANPVSWLTVSPTNGTLVPDGTAALVTVSLNSAASNLAVGTYTAIVWFTNLSDSVGIGRQYTLSVLSPPAITTQPSNQAVLYGATAVFSVTASGGQPLFYQWSANGANLTDGVNISGSSTNALTVSNVSPGDVGSYSVTVSNAALVVTSVVASLTITPSAPVIFQQPASQTAPLGAAALFTEAAYGNPPFSWQWTFSGTNLPGATNALLLLTNIQFNQSGNYAVAMTNAQGGTLSSNAVLTVVTGVIDVATFDDLALPEAAYTVLTNGYDGLNWNNFAALNGVALTNSGYEAGVISASNVAFNGDGSEAILSQSSAFNLISAYLTAAWNDDLQVELKGYVGGALIYDSTYILSATTPTNILVNYLGVTEVDFISSGGVHHSAYIGYGTQFVMDNMVVVEGAGSAINTIPVIYNFGPASDEVSQGQSTSLSVAAVGAPPLVYQWLMNGTSLAGQTNPTLNLTNAQPAVTGSYTVTVANAFGATTSAIATVTVVSTPVIIVQPQNQFTALGGNATLNVSALGAAALSYQWQFFGSNLSGATGTIETVADVSAANAGPYDVVVSNAYGSVTSAIAVLNVGNPPVIVTPPANQTGVLGEGVTLSIMVTGNGPLTYQWQQNGVNMAPSITTVAGNGGGGYSGDGGAATNASLYFPHDVAVDASGNLFIADTDNVRIRKVGANGIITTVAGNGTYGFFGDGGAATNAYLNDPQAVAVDASGNLFIADTYNLRIRRVGTNGIITTVAGDGGNGYSGDGGAATNTSLSYPEGVAVDGSGNIFIADTDNLRIRKVGANGIITTVAGDGGYGYFGDGGAATNAGLGYPEAVAVDTSGNIFIADTDDLRIRKVGTNGIITTVAGDGSSGYSGDGGTATSASLYYPEGVALDASGNFFIADTDNLRIRKVGASGVITTVAGDGNYGFSGDGAAATNANLSYPSGVALDTSGNLFIADNDNARIREVIVSSPNLSLSPLTLNDAGNYRVIVRSPYGSVTSGVMALTLSIPPSVVPQQPQNQTVVAGSDVTLNVSVTGTGPFTYQWQYNGANLAGSFGPGLALTGVAATMAGTYAIAVSSPCGSVTSMVAQLTVLPSLSSPVITTQPTNLPGVQGGNATFTVAVSGTGPFSFQWYGNGAALPPTIATVAGGSIVDGVPATNANLFNPNGSAVDAFGNLFIADEGNHRIRKVGTNGIITTVAGDGAAGYYGDGGPAINAGLYYPHGVAVDASGNLFIADTDNLRIRKVGTNGVITTVAGDGGYGYAGDGGVATNASLYYPQGVAVDASGNVFIADTENCRIRQVGTNGIISTVAGSGYYGFSGDGGAATNADMTYPFGLAVDAAGNLYIADSANDRIRQVGTNGIITTVAGNGSYGFSGDGGAATSASISTPYGVAVDAVGNFYIADCYNGRIRQVGSNGIITTVAGDGIYGYSGDGGVATSASMTYPVGVSVDNLGNLFIVDQNNERIRRVGINGIITTVAGNGSTGFPGDGGVAPDAHLNLPSGVAVDAAGNLFIADTQNYRIREAGINGLITTVAGNGNSGYSGDGGAATAANLDYPYGVAVDGVGDLFIADVDNQRLREVGVTGIITTVAGNGGFGFSGDGVALGPDASLADPSGTAVDAYGNLFIADTGNNRIRKITLNGIIDTVAGNGTVGFSGDGGPATDASLYSPGGVAVDAAGNLFIADTGNQRIREVGTNGMITTVAGNGFGGYSGDGGPATSAGLNLPRGVAVDASSNLFIADWANHRIRMVAATGVISSLAGLGGAGFFGDGGPATNASLAYPVGVATDPSGNLLVADSLNNRVREIWLAGQPTLSLNNLTANSAGNYYVVVKGPYGSVTSGVVNLAVALPPSITVQPQDLAIGLGSNATFAVLAASSEPLNYQWQFDGTNISGATSDSYTVADVAAADAGGYDVVVTNGIGSVTSRVAVLTVLLPPVIAQRPQSQVVGIGSNATFSVTASGNGPLYYQWFFDGANLTGATNSTLALNTVFPINAGSYFVSVANPYGRTLSSAAILTVLPLSLQAPEMASGGFQFGFNMAPGVNYTLEYSTDLITWFPLVTFTGNAGPILILDPNVIDNPCRFYRIGLSR
jgi:subtilase family serine protease